MRESQESRAATFQFSKEVDLPPSNAQAAGNRVLYAYLGSRSLPREGSNLSSDSNGR